MTRLNLNLCLKHGGGSIGGESCEMCHPTRCLTHDRPLPCAECKDISHSPGTTTSTVLVNQQSSGGLEERVAQLEGMLGMAQTSIAALNGEVAALRREVQVLRSL